MQGSFLFGYDTGVMGSVLELDSFKNDFGMAASSTGFKNGRNAEISSNVVSLLTAGCFFGALAAPWLNERLGRRYSLMIFSLVFMVGAAVQTGASHAIGTIYGGRVIAGLGIGGMSAITPVFVSENCPADVRGRISGLFQEFLVLGVMFSYWLCYGVKRNMAPTTMQWRVPVGLQLVPSGIMFCGLWFLKESPRWLAKTDRHDDALASLAYIRCVSKDDPEVLEELAEIRASVEEEFLATEGLSWKECLKPGYRERFVLAFCIMFWQQWSGTNSIGYYAPQIFASVSTQSRRCRRDVVDGRTTLEPSTFRFPLSYCSRDRTNRGTGRSHRRQHFTFCDRYLWYCQSNCYRNFPHHRHRTLRSQVAIGRWRYLDGSMHVHHRCPTRLLPTES